MTASSTTCGNCGETVSDADIICPHCDALLAAYASPDGAIETTPEYSTPSYAVPPTRINVVETEPASKPLFDTHITVSDVAEAAELDNPVELLLAGEHLPQEPTPEAKIASRLSNNTAPEPDEPAYPWSISEPITIVEELKTRPIPTLESATVGETEDYLRKLHRRSGYKTGNRSLSAPVATGRPKPEDRVANRAARDSARNRNQPRTPRQAPGLHLVLKIGVGFLWLIVLGTAVTGNVSQLLLVFTVALTLWLKMQTSRGGR